MNDNVLIAVYRGMVCRHHCSADDILHKPELREEFLSNSRQSVGNDVQECTLLSRLTYLRKSSKLPRSRDNLTN